MPSDAFKRPPVAYPFPPSFVNTFAKIRTNHKFVLHFSPFF